MSARRQLARLGAAVTIATTLVSAAVIGGTASSSSALGTTGVATVILGQDWHEVPSSVLPNAPGTIWSHEWSARTVLETWPASLYRGAPVLGYYAGFDNHSWVNTGLRRSYTTPKLSVGYHTLSVRAYNKDGQSWVRTVRIYVHSYVPNAPGTIWSHEWSARTVLETWPAPLYRGAPVLGYDARFDNHSWVNAGLRRSYTTPKLSVGYHTLSVRAYNKYGKSWVRMVRIYVPSTASAAGGANCGTTVVHKADGTAWQCTFDEEFSGSQLDTTKWVPQTSFVSGNTAGMHACYQNSPNNISVSNGALHLTMRKETQPMSCPGGLASSYYSAGMISTYHLFSQEYGRFEVRMRAPATNISGLNEDFWMWPDNRYSTINWPASGEMDVNQQFSVYPNDSIPYLHYTSNDNGGPIRGVNMQYCAAQRGVWNTYDLVWTPTSITISINGTTCLVNTSGASAFQKRYIINLTEAMGAGFDMASASTLLPATMDVDYVRVWR